MRLIKNFSEIKENDFDILMVNSDQTWRKCMNYFYDVAFLKFAEHWNKIKFNYGSSLGVKVWTFNKEDEKIAKNLLKNFTGLSVREISDVELIKKHLGFKVQFVLDPTLLIDKKYYLKLIKNFESDIINQVNNNNYFFSYIIDKNNQVEEFLYGIINSKGVITDSYHGTIFSIIFKKPFISFQEELVDSRFNSLKKILDIQNRIFTFDSIPPISLLNQPLIINETKL